MNKNKFEKSVKRIVSSVKRIEYVEKYDFYCVVVSGSVTFYELNQLNNVCHVSNVSCSDTGCVEVICRLSKVDFTPYYLHERGEL